MRERPESYLMMDLEEGRRKVTHVQNHKQRQTLRVLDLLQTTYVRFDASSFNEHRRLACMYRYSSTVCTYPALLLLLLGLLLLQAPHARVAGGAGEAGYALGGVLAINQQF